jgi:hypothetical protein
MNERYPIVSYKQHPHMQRNKIPLDIAVVNRDWFTVLALIRSKAPIFDINRVCMGISGRDEEMMTLFIETYPWSVFYMQYWLARRRNIGFLNTVNMKYGISRYVIEGFVDSNSTRQLSDYVSRTNESNKQAVMKAIAIRCGHSDNVTVFKALESYMRDSDLEIAAMYCAEYGSINLLSYILEHYPLNDYYHNIAVEARQHGHINIVEMMVRKYNTTSSSTTSR